MYVPYGMYKRVAVVTHVSDEKSIETEDGDGKLKIQVKHTFVLNFFSLPLFFFLSLSTERSYRNTHTHSLSPVFAFPRPYRILHYINKSFLFGRREKKAESSYWRRKMIRKKKIKNKHCPHSNNSNSSSGNKNIIINQVLVQKYPPIRPAGRIRSDQRHEETDIDKRQNKTGGFRSHTQKKSPQSTFFRPKNFPVGDCMNHI